MRSEWHWFVRCDLQIFSGCVCHLEQLHAQSPFLFPIVFSINNYYAKCMVWCWREDFPKRRMVRKGLEGEGGLESEDREAGGLRHEAGASVVCVWFCVSVRFKRPFRYHPHGYDWDTVRHSRMLRWSQKTIFGKTFRCSASSSVGQLQQKQIRQLLI